jgi:hypothetical protein
MPEIESNTPPTPEQQTIMMLTELDKRVDMLANVAEKLTECVEPFTLGFASKSLMDNVKLYNIVLYLKAVAKEIGRVANVVDPIIAERITKRMQQDELENIRYGGYSYTPSEDTYVNVTAENKPIVLGWLKKHNHGHELVREDYNANALTSFVEKQLAEGKQVHPAINVFTQPTLSRRKVKA